jgi:hypothetical protein
MSWRSATHLPPDRAARAEDLEPVHRCRPEDAAALVGRKLFGETLVIGELLSHRGKHEQDMAIIGGYSPDEVPDIDRRLSEKPVDGFRSSVPLEVEDHLLASDEVPSPAVWRRRIPRARFLAEQSPAPLLAHPVVQPFISKRAASDGQCNEERIRPQVVPDVEAMIAGVLAEADQRSRFLVTRGGKEARPTRR